MVAGDKVVLQAGTYYTGELLINSSGTMQQPIVFEGETGTVLDGSVDTAIIWKRITTDTANIDYNMFYANLSGLNTNCIILNNRRMYPYRNVVELRYFQTIRSIDGSGFIDGNYSIGLSGFFRDGRSPSGNYWPYVGYNPNTYIKFADGTDTAGKELHVSRMGYAFKSIGQSNIQFRNINFKYFGSAHLQQNYRCAFAFDNCDSVLIDNCHFEFCDRGITFTGNCDNNIVQHCRFDDDFGDWSYFQFKETNEDYQHLNTNYPNFFPYKFRYIETGRVYFDHGFTGRGNILRYNVFNGGCDGITCPDTPGDTTRSRNFDIYENEFMHGSDDAFEVDGNASNVRVWGNVMHGTGNGISSSSPCYGPLYVFRNRIYDLKSSPYEYIYSDITGYHLYSDTPRASPMKLNAAYCDIPGKVYFVHNTCDVGNDSYGFVAFQPQAQSSWSNLVAKNNIFYNESNNYTLWVRCNDKIDFDHNNYYSTQNFTARKDRGGIYGLYNSLAQISQNIIGDLNDTNSYIETHGLQLNPQSGWRNEANHDYRLLPSSNMIDKGILIKGLNDNFTGTAPDMGAYEYQPPVVVRDTVNSFYPSVYTDSSQTYDTVLVNNISGISDIIVVTSVTVTCDTISSTTEVVADSSLIITLDTVFVSYTFSLYDSTVIHCIVSETDSVFIPEMITEANNISADGNWCVYPNPSDGKLTIIQNGNEFATEAILQDLIGKQVISIHLTGATTIADVSAITIEGIYYLKLQNEHYNEPKKIVVLQH